MIRPCIQAGSFMVGSPDILSRWYASSAAAHQRIRALNQGKSNSDIGTRAHPWDCFYWHASSATAPVNRMVD